ncbi:MAG: hypothetical protein IPP07_02065 [Holophagales bacterium]|nr:hypothetical protein [Holophagales bacterium]
MSGWIARVGSNWSHGNAVTMVPPLSIWTDVLLTWVQCGVVSTQVRPPSRVR